MYSLQVLTERVRALVGLGEDLGKSFKLDLKGEGVIHIDGAAVCNDDLPADLVVRVSRADLAAMGKGKLNPMTAVITGRVHLSDMGLAMSLQPQMQSLFARLA